MSIFQVLGGGSHRTLTLAHRVQIRRFTSDLLRVLKAQTHKQCTLSEFPSLFEKLLNRPFDPVDYGLCYLEDLLSQVPDYVVVMTQSETDTIIAIPKREQTPEEIERTKIFAAQVMKRLLSFHNLQSTVFFFFYFLFIFLNIPIFLIANWSKILACVSLRCSQNLQKLHQTHWLYYWECCHITTSLGIMGCTQYRQYHLTRLVQHRVSIWMCITEVSFNKYLFSRKFLNVFLWNLQMHYIP